MPVFLKFQPHERVFYDIFAPGAIGEMGLHYTKLEKMARSAVIPTIDHSKTSRSRRNEQPIPPTMKNVRYQPNNPTETRTIPARTQIAKQYSELGSNDSTGNKLPISLSTAAADMPRRSGFPRGEEVESRGWRRGAPQSPSPSSFGAPARSK